MGRTCCYFTVLYMKYMREKREIKNLQMFQLNYLLFIVTISHTHHLEKSVTCMLVCWQAFSLRSLGESAKFGGINIPRASYAEPRWTFDFLGTLQ